MSILQYPWKKEIMISFYKKESASAYGETLAVSAANFSQMNAFLSTPESNDVVANDLEQTTGSEIVVDQEIVEFATNIPMEFPKATPDVLVGIGTMCMGTETETKDGAFDAWQHYMIPSTDSSSPSANLVIDPANRQDTYTGVKAGNLALSCEQGDYWKLATQLLTSGQLQETSETFQSYVKEVWLKARDTQVYIKTNPVAATDIVAPANMSQDGPNIDGVAAAITSIGNVVESWSLEMNNNSVEVIGQGGAGYKQEICAGKRSYTLTMKLKYVDDTIRGYFTDDPQVPLALEFNCKATSAGAIAAGGAFFFGGILRIPKCKLKKRPDPQGGPTDSNYTTDLEFEIIDDGVNPAIDLTVYNAIETYFAA